MSTTKCLPLERCQQSMFWSEYVRMNEWLDCRRGLGSSQTLNCISSAGNQLFIEGLRSVLVRSDPSGGFLGLSVKLWNDNGRFVLKALFNLSGSNTGDVERGGVHSIVGITLCLLKEQEWLLPAESGLDLEIASSMWIVGIELFLKWSFWVSDEMLPSSVSIVVAVTVRILLEGVSYLDSSVSWVWELCALFCSKCFLLQNFINIKMMTAAIRKQTTKVTATEMLIAVATWELTVPWIGAVSPVERERQ